MPDHTSLPDDELLRAARSGDRAAISMLLERHAAAVYRFGLKMCRNPDDAQDVVQETLLAAAKGLESFRGDASLLTWLYTVARSFCLKKHRTSKFAPARIESLDANPELANVATNAREPDEAAHERQLAHALDAALDTLEPAQREVLLLRDGEGFTAPEVATIVGISVDAVKSRLHRARKELRARLEPFLPDGEHPGAHPKTPSCPEILSVFSRYLEDEIGKTECDAMQAHVASCKRCDAACNSLRHALSLCRSAPRARIPAQVQAAVHEALQAIVEPQRPVSG